MEHAMTVTLYMQVAFYARVTFLKKSHKSNTKFPFKMVYFLGGKGIDSLILYSVAIPLVDI
jgi:hypothetical protein